MKKKNVRYSVDTVREAYLKSGLPYSKIAELMGVSRNTLACWITQLRQPPDYVIDVLLEKLDSYKKGGVEYINKQLSRALLEKNIQEFCQEEQVEKVMQVYDTLPIVIK